MRDASGGVLPGVTVEAASPALIEKVRTAVTDGTGQYRFTDLRPGTYTLTFTLTGFTTVRREGVEVSGAAVITINADMRVGGVQETITVSGETPVVDVQTSTKKQTVLDDSVVEALPATRGYGNLLAAVPGIQTTGLDNGTNPAMTFFTAHGGRGNEGTVQIDGMNVGAAFNGGGVSEFGYDTANAAGSPGHRRRRSRRGRSRRSGVQHDSEDRRQHVQRQRLHQLRRRLVAGQQPRRRAEAFGITEVPR